jgi:hypothetical protein
MLSSPFFWLTHVARRSHSCQLRNLFIYMNIQNETVQGTVLVLGGRIEQIKTAHAYLLWKARGLEVLLQRLQNERNALRNQLSPVSSLPNELLSAVFEALASDMSPTSPPIEIVLSHVSRRFRRIAMNTRQLWTRINVSLDTPFDMVVAYLERSGTRPFELRFDIAMYPDSGSVSDSEFDLDVLLYNNSQWKTIMSYMTRCRQLSMVSNQPEIIHDMVKNLHAIKAPLLESIQIQCYDLENAPYLDFHTTIIDGGAPALTSILIEGWGLHQCLPPLTSITSLTLLRATWLMEWTDFRDIVGGLLALTCLVIGDIFYNNLIPDNFESTIVLPSLKSLRIYANHDSCPLADQILLATSAPALEILVLICVLEQDLEDISQSLNSDRFPRLRYLSILSDHEYEYELSQQSWILFCSVFPCVTHFTLQSNADDLIMALASLTPLILPNLHTLSFGHISARPVTSLCNLVTNRNVAGRPLSSLQIPTATLHHKAFASSLHQLRESVEVEEYQAYGKMTTTIMSKI